MEGGLAPGSRKGGGIQAAPVCGADRGLVASLWWSRWQPGLYSHLRGEVGTATSNETMFLPTPVELYVMASPSHKVQQGKGTRTQKDQRPYFLASVLTLLGATPELTRSGY